MPHKVFYDGDASKIIGDRVILELIQEKKIQIRDNKVWFNICDNSGTTREMAPIYTLGKRYDDCMYSRAFEGSWIYKCEKGAMRIDYDLEILDRMVYLETGKHILEEGDVEDDNGTLK